MTDPARYIRTFDPERALSQLDQDQQALAKMTGADAVRIDGLVKDVGAIKGSVSAVKGKVDDVAFGVNKLNDAMANLVRFQLQVEQTHAAQEGQRSTSLSQDLRIQALERKVEPLLEMKLGDRVPTLEKQIGPVLELRTWVIGGGLSVVGLLVVALIKLVVP
jgi:hypothetical protein